MDREESSVTSFLESDIVEFMHAAEKGDVKKLTYFLDRGLDPDVLSPQSDIRSCMYSGIGDTALVKACRDDQLEAMRLLIRRGADVNAVTGDRMKHTALHVAVEEHSITRARFLLSHGADSNIINSNGSIPLMLAAQQHQPDLVQLLLEFGSNVNHQDSEGKTALHRCFDVYYGLRGEIPHLVKSSISCADLLIEGGADMDIFSADLETPLLLAVTRYNAQGAKFLLMQNCDPDLPAEAYKIAETTATLRSPPTSPLHAAVASKDMELVKSLILAGCRFEDCSGLNISDDAKARVRALMSGPRSLIECCRLVVRHTLRRCGGVGSRQVEIIERLPLPAPLKDYLLLKDLRPCACSVM